MAEAFAENTFTERMQNLTKAHFIKSQIFENYDDAHKNPFVFEKDNLQPRLPNDNYPKLGKKGYLITPLDDSDFALKIQ